MFLIPEQVVKNLFRNNDFFIFISQAKLGRLASIVYIGTYIGSP